MNLRHFFTQFVDLFNSSPVMAVALIAGAVALATTPLAFVLMGQMKWFNARRGRTLQRPVFWSVVCSMMLVMGIPAIFLAVLVKSESFDHSRYEFNPNLTISPLDQGRQYESLKAADEAVRAEEKRLALIRKDLTDSVKKLDTSMLALREAARVNPAVIKPMNGVLEHMGAIHKAVGLDAPQQLVNLKADPAALGEAPIVAGAAPAPMVRTDIPPPPTAPPVAAASNGLPPAEIQAILTATPDPQKPLAAMLPLSEVPAGWVVSKLPGKGEPKFIETFNDQNLFEKIDGRAESFIQNSVKGMACCSYYPQGHEENEVQLFIFEMGDGLRAQAKYDSEKSDDAKSVAVGTNGYVAADSVFFHLGPYYTIVNVASQDPKQAAFALEIAKKVASQQKSGPVASGPSAEDLFNLLPAEPKKTGPKFVAQDVFGYSFLSDVFTADYSAGGSTFQGFLRPCESAAEAKAIYEKYLAEAKTSNAKITMVEGSKAEQMFVSSNIGLVDAVFLKGNAVGGVNGGPDVKTSEAFGREFAASLPEKVPVIASEKKKPASDNPDAAEK